MANIRLEAESMTLMGYEKESANFASGGQLIRIPNDGISGTATTQFTGAAGTYDLKVVYHDESDGQGKLKITADQKLNDGTIERTLDGIIELTENTGNSRAGDDNRRERVFSGVVLDANSTIQIEGFLETGEVARVDYIELIPKGGTGGNTAPPAPVNKAPIASNDSATTQAGTPVAINVLSNDSDPDGDALNISNVGNAANGTVSNTNGTLTYTPKAGFSGSDSFNYSISDGKGGSATATVGVTVNPAQQTGGSGSGNSGGGNSSGGNSSGGTPSVVRIEAEAMTLSSGYEKESASFASGGQLIRLSGGKNDPTSGTATTQFTGAAGTYDLKVVYHDESDGNSKLEIKAGSKFATSFMFDENPNSSRASTDNRREKVFSGVQLEANATITLKGFLDQGEVARVDYIELIPKGGTGGNTAPPAPVNKAPIASNDSATTQAGTPVAINVLSNDSDPDGDALNISNVGNAANGTVSNTNGTLTYTPKAGFSGNDSFNYSISDGKGGSATATVGVTVNPAQQTGGSGSGNSGGGNSSGGNSSGGTPSVVRIEAEAMTLSSGYEKESASFASGGQLIRLSGGKNDPTSGTATTQFTGAAGTYDLKVVYHDESDGNSTINLKAGQFTAKVELTEQTSSSRASENNRRERVFSNVNLTTGDKIELEGILDQGEVARLDYIELIPKGGTGGTTTPPAPVNKAPIASNDSAATQAGTPVAINVLNNDSDPDGDTLNISNVGNAANGTVSNTNGTLTYTPKAGFSGSDSFNYSISDGKGGSATATVGVTVTPAPSGGGSTGGGSTGGGTASVVRIEAESMTLVGYEKESASFASGGQLIRVPNEGGKSTATTQFSGVAGTYDLKVVYHDESDGKSTLKITAGTGFATSFDFDENTGNTRASSSNRRERVFTGVQLKANDTIQLEGFLESGEVARVDYIELVPTGGTGGTTTPPGSGSGGGSTPSSGSSTAGGVILNLDTGVGLSPEFGALKMPRLMPLGDSITAGQHSKGAVPGGYRIQLEDRAIADGLSIDFVGSQKNGGSDLADKDHAGFPGRTINQTTSWVKDNLSKYPVDGILLMIGTNDANGNASGTVMRDRLSTLIDEISKAAPSAYIYVSSIPPVDSPRGSENKRDNINEYNRLIKDELVGEKVKEGKKVFFVDAGGSLGVGDINGDHSATNDLDDGLHPTAAGYDKLGNAWYKEIFNPKSLSGNKLVGTKYDDWLTGNSSNNVIEGGDGQDELTGGGGADIFVYKDPTHGKDRIVDFSSNDLLQISAAGFGGGLSASMTLDGSSFISGSSPSATSNKATFLFNTGNKTLSFDRDGTGSGSALEIATFTNGYSLHSDQIDIVA